MPRTAAGCYREGRYTWIAPPEDLISGKVIPKFRLAILAFSDPRDGSPAPQKIISMLTGIPESRISEYAMGKRPISPRNLLKFCEVMRVNPDDLLGVEYNE